MSVGLDPRLGTELAGYRIERLLGRGGMSVVYLAEDTRLRRKVALKLLAPELAADERFRERFLRESRLAASLDHSHVIPIYEAGESEGVLYIAMRYVEGTDLKTLLAREGALEPRRALGLVFQVASALDAAHERGLVHRDVKPGNVLLTREGGEEHVYLSDFGLTKETSSESGLTETGQFVGTGDYMAPEQIERRRVDGKADVYSLGCVLFECLTGEVPFPSDRLMGVLWAHVNEPPPAASERNPALPVGFDAVVARAMAKSPDDRYSSCRDLVEAARAELGFSGELPQALAPSFRVRRWRWPLVAIAAIAVAVALVLALVLTGSGQEQEAPRPVLPLAGDSLVRIDPATGEAVAATSVDTNPVGVAVGEGSVWVISTGDRLLTQIDAKTNAIVSTVSLPTEDSPNRIAVGEGAVWTVPTFGVLKYQPATNTLSVLLTQTGFTSDIAAGQGAVWVGVPSADTSGFGTTGYDVLRLDPETGAIVASVSGQSLRSETDSALRLAVGDGGVWTASQLGGRVARIDPATNTVTRTADVSDALDGIAVGEGAVWALNADDDLVLRIDPATLRVTGTVRVGRSPTAVAAGAGAVWATSARDGTVTRIDPGTFDVEIIDVGGAATDVAVGLGGVWVAVDAR